MFHGSLDGRGVWGENGHIYMCVAESLHRSPETTTTLFDN